LVIKGGNVVNVHTRELLENVDVAVRFGRIALVGDASPCMGLDTLVYEAEGKYVVPGLLDPHVHIESSMVTVTEFAKIVLPHGTTTVFIDPHEIGNVFGLDGVRLMAEESRNLPLKVYITYPFCVEGMTAGRGFISLALVILATWSPLRAILCALLFGGVETLQFRLPLLGVAAQLPQFLLMLPYIVTIITLTLLSLESVRKRVGAPAALGIPYTRE
jgi:hypothetical protein